MEEMKKENQVIRRWWTGEPHRDEGKGNMHIM
jgi:hypothetical protein